MKNVTKMLLVALAAVAMVTVVFACDKEKSADKTADKAGGCPHAAMAAKEGGCTHEAKEELAAYKSEAGGCPFHSQATDAQRAALLKGEQVTLVGQVICASCDLKQTKECKSLFKTADGQLYAIVGNDASEKLTGQTRHGEKKVEIVGTTAKDSSESILLLQSFKLIS